MHTVKFSFKHEESAFIFSWYVVCQPLDVSAAPLRKAFHASFPVDVKEIKAEATGFCCSNT